MHQFCSYCDGNHEMSKPETKKKGKNHTPNERSV
ncbi:unnamed protein product [Brugia pahangi]|uniref:50S ribosomal protein L33 n=1 Tax=Brugia pahangi TaxID=6280 RepID=A0A0N4TXD5_BRUPA|nr:unnamed protein product [Brugia pahangi]